MGTASLPTGTVTFLFTDIEGSTRLLQHLGDRYADLLADQRCLLRAAFHQWHGYELGTEGDSFFVAFSRASDALAAVVEAQRTLAAHPWPEGTSVRVRMGLHTGEPTLTPEGYIGLDVHRAARINACSHGGQILLSQRTHDLVVDQLPNGAILRDMGAHRLKDLLQPEHLFQVVIEGLPADFPPLKSLSAHPNNLPLQLTTFIGRERELAELRERLPTTRLVTLTGAAGTGKTRLALQLAAEQVELYADGVWLVELAALAEPSLLPQAVASALHLREEPGRSLMETLIGYLEGKQLLLLLDNCEHLVAACSRLAAALLQRCPKLTLLATSREPLGIPGEQSWQVPSLPVPDPHRLPREADLVTTVTQYEGVRLFLDRAFLHEPRFAVTGQNAPAVAEVCHRLDGIPLALELAAARVKALPVEQIARRLDDRFRLLTGGSRTLLPRQQTLQAAIDWSYDLLSEGERVLLRRLSVFAGGLTLGAAEVVCSGEGVEEWEVLDLVSQLVDRSLLVAEEAGGEGRYRLLETIREYGAEKLEGAAEGERLRERHRDWFLALAEQAGPELRGPRQADWLERLEREHENLRAALDGALRRHDAETCLRLGAVLGRFWLIRGYLGEGRERLAQIMAVAGASDEPSLRATVLNHAGALAFRQGEYEAARSYYEESLAIRRVLGDRPGVAGSLNNLGLVAQDQGDYEASRSFHEESLSIMRELGNREGISHSLINLGMLVHAMGHYTLARSLLQEALEIQRQLGHRQAIAFALNNLANVVLDQGEHALARRLHEESLEIKRELGDQWGIASSLHNLGFVALGQGDLETAWSSLEEGLAIRRRLGDRRGIADSLYGMARAAVHRREDAVARSLYEQSLAIRRELGDRKGLAAALNGLGNLASARGDHAEARSLHEESLTLRQELGDRPGLISTLEGIACALRAQGEFGRAVCLFAAAQRQRADLGGAPSAPLGALGSGRSVGKGPAVTRPDPPLSEPSAERRAPSAPSSPERAEYEQVTVELRAALGEPAFAAAWAEGEAMSLEEAVRIALEITQASPGEGR
jgi:predicted ATPase/class 3 adenylate cyclase